MTRTLQRSNLEDANCGRRRNNGNNGNGNGNGRPRRNRTRNFVPSSVQLHQLPIE